MVAPIINTTGYWPPEGSLTSKNCAFPRGKGSSLASALLHSDRQKAFMCRPALCSSQIKLKKCGKWCQWGMLQVHCLCLGIAGLGREGQAPSRASGGGSAPSRAGEASGCAESSSKRKLRPMLATCLSLKGHPGPEAMGTKSKFIILNASPRNTGLARALIPILQKNQLRYTAVLCA